MNARPTMQDVARLAGVSIKTVSRVVNQEPRVDPDTRARVQATIDELGFRRNEQARSLRPGQSSSLIGLVSGDLGNPFYSAIARGIEEITYGHGHLLLTASSEEQPARERQLIETYLQHNVAGLIVAPTLDAARTITPELLRGVPLVSVDRPVSDPDPFDTVLLDNRAGARRAVTRLIEDGHTRIAIIDGNPRVYTGQERTAGYLDALREAGIAPQPNLMIHGHHGARHAEQATHDLLNQDQRPSAIFATNNRIATGVIRALHARRRTLAVASFDNFEFADVINLPLTLVSYDAMDLGRAAAKRLMQRIQGDGGPPQRLIQPVTLRVPGEQP
ncbi:LacI family DNA-binding transcriptional regulator [Deinococcus sedimenti]|uniref:LacI family transcriptional regulator n=1 Tax=Deinococcus sedimenti TaxID=1867090 RepID=A0ABQ2S8Y5_9DEIO|nr:LacI family DNA-binding transcriptional regulator [Deinococcus sedimenti]GGS03760.1 LacI family transcriptional regulator [Deinococcus sedimenti]